MRGLLAAFFAGAAFFCLLADGGVFSSNRSESSLAASSWSEFSSSESGFARFFGFGATLVGLSVVCLAAFAVFGFGAAAAFLAGAFAGALAF